MSTLRATKLQRQVLSALTVPGVYLSYAYGKQWQVCGASLRVHGVTMDWTIPARTVECLKAQGFIVFDKRERNARSQVGYFLVPR